MCTSYFYTGIIPSIRNVCITFSEYTEPISKLKTFVKRLIPVIYAIASILCKTNNIKARVIVNSGGNSADIIVIVTRNINNIKKNDEKKKVVEIGDFTLFLLWECHVKRFLQHTVVLRAVESAHVRFSSDRLRICALTNATKIILLIYESWLPSRHNG